VFIPSFHNYRIWSFLGLGMTTYTAWYLTIAALVHGRVSKTNNNLKCFSLVGYLPFEIVSTKLGLKTVFYLVG